MYLVLALMARASSPNRLLNPHSRAALNSAAALRENERLAAWENDKFVAGQKTKQNALKAALETERKELILLELLQRTEYFQEMPMPILKIPC